MRVLVLTSLFPNRHYPNRATFNRQHISALAVDHEVELVCPVSWVEKMKMGWRKPLHLESLPFRVRYPTYWYPPAVMRGLYGEFMAASVLAILKERVLAFRPDVLLAIWAYPEGAVALKVKRSLGVPVAIQVLGSDVNLLGQFPSRQKPTQIALQSADLVLPVSKALRQRIVSLGVVPEKVRVVYRGVDRDLFKPRSSEACRRELGLGAAVRHVLFVGNLVPVKAVDDLIEAFARVCMGGAMELHILGDGPLRSDLEAKTVELGCAHVVRFHGTVDHARLPFWYGAADLVVLPSLSEGVPNVLLEARSCSRPYVASAVGGIPEISSHDAACLVPAGDIAALAKAITDKLNASKSNFHEPPGWQSWEAAGANLANELKTLIGD